MNITEILEEYECKITNTRGRTLTPQEILTNIWKEVTRLLEERASSESTSRTSAKLMRVAAREIRVILELRGDGEISPEGYLEKARSLIHKDKELLERACRQCHHVCEEVLERHIMNRDYLARMHAAGHTYKRRIGSVLSRLNETIKAFINSLKGML